MEVSGYPHVLTILLPEKQPSIPIEQEDGCAPELVLTFWGSDLLRLTFQYIA
jgi:hypothetical protein